MPSRRDLFRQALNLSTASVFYTLLPKSPFKVGEKAYAAIKTISDIKVVAVGRVTPLLAKDLLAGVSVDGKIDEGSHTHVYTISAEQIAQVNAGKVVTLTSGKGSDGSGAHRVTIDPKAIVANGSSIQFFEAENGELIGLRLGDGSEPYLYVEGVEGLEASTVKYCVKSAVACQQESAFESMEAIDSIPGRTIYSSIDRLKIDSNQQVFVWATTLSNKKVKLAVKIGS